jgi:hypothetical protein
VFVNRQVTVPAEDGAEDERRVVAVAGGNAADPIERREVDSLLAGAAVLPDIGVLFHRDWLLYHASGEDALRKISIRA